MEFSDEELKVITAAKKNIRIANLFRIFLVIVILCGISIMFSGMVVADELVYLALASVLLAIALPQIGPGPKYEDLLKILENKANVQRSTT